jgi:heme-degrading monooxygenase HmoA
MDPLASTPQPPYYAVIFTSLHTGEDQGYEEMADRMEALARAQPGFLGLESAQSPDGAGITISYWASAEAIRGWREQLDHRAAQERGRAAWYRAYQVRVCRVERAYGFERASEDSAPQP